MITRPAHQASNLVEGIALAGGESFLFPTLNIIAAESSAENEAIIQKINHYDIVIFISPNAVEHGLNLIQKKAALSKNTQLATIGQGSARALKSKLGVLPDISPKDTFNSEGLLDTTELQHVENKNILIVRGNGGRTLLKETLEKRGAHVEYLNAYQRVKPVTDTSELELYLQNNKIAAIVITSGESLKNLVELTPSSVMQQLLKVPLLLINKRLIDIAKKAGFTSDITIATEASDDSIINGLKDSYLS